MKIIFDSEAQKAIVICVFIDGLVCPDDYGLTNHEKCNEDVITCRQCWEQCGIEMEVKGVVL